LFMLLIDYGITLGFMKISVSAFWAKSLATGFGFIGNFASRKWLIFSKKNKSQRINLKKNRLLIYKKHIP